MTAAVLDPRLTAADAARRDDRLATRARDWLTDVAVLTKRNLVHVAREPAQLSDATIQPILFTGLMVFIFQASMHIPGGGGYKAFAIGGLITMNLTTASMGTAVGLSSDLSTGVVNRFRTLPMARSAILTGRTLSDLLASALCGSIVVATGLAIGWRPESGLTGVLGALAVAVLFAYALSWLTACFGLLVTDPESAQAVGFLVLFPMAFVSSCFAPTQGMPAWMRTIADWSPVSAVAASCRHLMGDPNPAALVHNFPSQHPVLVALLWSVAIVAVCAPISSRLLRRRTTD
ncbi:MAG TPA: ABC transporter permease [Acidimicrobiales bacterium]|jgi:ABC transporter DrrB family efflux protein|nr:ABC transporter permease [Acidimicrobiales bacterium]